MSSRSCDSEQSNFERPSPYPRYPPAELFHTPPDSRSLSTITARRHTSTARRGNPGQVLHFPSDRYLRAARRRADLSQRELAARAGVSQSCVARIEHSPQLAKVDHLAWLLSSAGGLRLIVVDEAGTEIGPEDEVDAERRDRGHRRYPAHLDLRPGTEDWWGEGWPMFTGLTPEYTFDRKRSERDWRRESGWDRAY